MGPMLAPYDCLARIFEAPGPEYPSEIRDVADALRSAYPAATEALERFGALLPADAKQRDELFVRTFDVQAITTLDLGYVLFGEDYKRGALLAGLSAEHKHAGNDCGSELGDHLPNVLRLLPKLADTEIRAELVQVVVGPAVREMLREFEPARIARKEEIYRKHHKTIIEHAGSDCRVAYRHALAAVYAALRADFDLPADDIGTPERPVERGIATEMEIESPGPCGPNV